MADDQVKVRFSKAYKVKGASGESFKEGQTVAMSRASADHYINRGIAEDVAAAKEAGPIEDDGSPDGPIDPTSMTKADLQEYARANNVQGVTSASTKDELAAAVTKHQRRPR
jgi:hypothetical protein